MGFSNCYRARFDGLRLKHAIEVRHPSFCDTRFYELARQYGVAIVFAKEEDFPEIDEQTTDFTYARLMSSREDLESGIEAERTEAMGRQARSLGEARRCLCLFHLRREGQRNPSAAQALLSALKSG